MPEAKKVIVILLSIVTFTMILSGCAEAPDGVKKEIEEIKKAKEEKKRLEESLVFIEPSQLEKEAKENFSLDHGVFKFEGSVVAPKCENVYFLELKMNDEIFGDLDKNMPLLMEIAGEEKGNWKNYITEESYSRKRINGEAKSYVEGAYCFTEMKNVGIAVVGVGGISIYLLENREEHPHYWEGEIRKTYFLVNHKEKVVDEEIDLNGEKTALKTLNDVFEKNVSAINECSPNLNLISHDVRISVNSETGNTIAVFRALSNYKGVCFDPNYITTQDSDLTGGRSFVGFGLEQHMHYKGDNLCMMIIEDSYLVSKEKKKIDKVIDFESALSIVEHTVPQDRITVIESAELLYQMYYEGEEGQTWESSYEKPPVFYASPVWKFVEKERRCESEATVYYVDAVSGEILSFYQSCTP